MQLRVGSADGGDPAARALELLDVEAAESVAAKALGAVARTGRYARTLDRGERFHPRIRVREHPTTQAQMTVTLPPQHADARLIGGEVLGLDADGSRR
jgi:hypothetical protein